MWPPWDQKIDEPGQEFEAKFKRSMFQVDSAGASILSIWHYLAVFLSVRNADGLRDMTVIILCGLSCITLPFLREISAVAQVTMTDICHEQGLKHN